MLDIVIDRGYNMAHFTLSIPTQLLLFTHFVIYFGSLSILKLDKYVEDTVNIQYFFNFTMDTFMSYISTYLIVVVTKSNT